MSRFDRKILVFRTGHLGDTVCAIPAFRLIRQAFPSAHLSLLCDEPDGPLVSALDVVRRLNLFDSIRGYRSRRGWRTGADLAWQVLKMRPDMALLLPQTQEQPEDLSRKCSFFQLCGVKDVRGQQALRPVHDWHPTEAERLVQLLHRMGLPEGKPGYEIPVDAADLASAQAKLHASGINSSRPFMVFCGGGKVSAKFWPLARYAEVLKCVEQEFRLSVMALGSPSEIARYRSELLPLFPNLKLPATPFTIPELFEVCRLAVAYLGNDTGPMHVAASVGCPVAAIFSSRAAPGAWDPDVESRLIFRHRTFCEGCGLDDCVAEKLRCLTSITVEDVVDQLIPFLRKILGETTKLEMRKTEWLKG